jgi:hypothetical protein
VTSGCGCPRLQWSRSCSRGRRRWSCPAKPLHVREPREMVRLGQENLLVVGFTTKVDQFFSVCQSSSWQTVEVDQSVIRITCTKSYAVRTTRRRVIRIARVPSNDVSYGSDGLQKVLCHMRTMHLCWFNTQSINEIPIDINYCYWLRDDEVQDM